MTEDAPIHYYLSAIAGFHVALFLPSGQYLAFLE